MGKEAVRNQLHVFLDDVTQYALEDISLLNIVHLGWLPLSGPQDRFWKFVMSPLINKELNIIKVSLQNEFNVILDLAEEMNEEGEADPEEYYDRFLQHDFFYQNYEGPHEEEFRDLMEQRVEEVAEDLAPLLAAESDNFWGALVETYEIEEAKDMLTYHFSFTEKLVDRFGDGLKLQFKLMPLLVFDYTDEAVRVLPDAEGYLREQMIETIEEEFKTRAVEEREQLEQENEELREKVEELEQKNEKLMQKLKEARASSEGAEAAGEAEEPATGVDTEPEVGGDEAGGAVGEQRDGAAEEPSDGGTETPLDVDEAEDEFGLD